MSEDKWYITRTGHEPFVLQLSDDVTARLRMISGALFPVAFSSEQEANAALDFIARAIDKSIIAALKEAGRAGGATEGST